MNGYYNPATWLTYLNMIFGVLGINYAFMQNIPLAVVCLVISGVCDMFDGTVAKLFDRTPMEKNYGIQIDSLADIVSFGILPGTIGLSLGRNQFPYIFISAFYILAALIRLAYFNVTEQELLNNAGQKRVFYEGLPVTSAAIIIPLVYLLSLSFGFSLPVVYGFLLVICGIAFVTKFRVCKLKMRSMILLGCISVVAVFMLIKSVVLHP